MKLTQIKDRFDQLHVDRENAFLSRRINRFYTKWEARQKNLAPCEIYAEIYFQ